MARIYKSLDKIKINNHKSKQVGNIEQEPQISRTNAHGNSSKHQEIYTISDSEDEPIVTTNTSKNKKDSFDGIFTTSESEDEIIATTNTSKNKKGSFDGIFTTSESEDELIVTTNKSKNKKFSKKKPEIFTILDSEDEPIVTTYKSKNKKFSKKKPKIFTISDSEDEPIVTTNTSKNKKDSFDGIFTTSESEDEIIVTTNKSKNKKGSFDGIFTTSESEDELIVTTNKSKNKKGSKKKPVMFTISDSEDEPIVTTDTSKINGNNKVLPISTKFNKALKTGKCLSSTIRKRKPGQTKTMVVSDSVPSDVENTKTFGKNICTTNSLDSTVKKLKATEKDYSNFQFKFSRYPPPYPYIPPHNTQPSWKNVPPIPSLKIRTTGNKIILTWDLQLTCQTAKIKMYELFVCQETDADPDVSMWKKTENIEPYLLPMSCEIEVFALGYIYHFALRAVDVHNRCAPFAIQKTKI